MDHATSRVRNVVRKREKYNRIKKTPKWNFYSCRIVPFAGKFNFRMNISRTSRVEFSYQWLMFFFQFERWAPCRCNIQRVKVYKSSFHWACVYLSGSCWARYVFFPILFVVEAKRSSIYRWLYYYYVFFRSPSPPVRCCHLFGGDKEKLARIFRCAWWRYAIITCLCS